MNFYMPWTYVPGANGWQAHNVWLAYLYEPDRGYLEKMAYPLVREMAEFYTGFLGRCRKTPAGKAIYGPSYSPMTPRATSRGPASLSKPLCRAPALSVAMRRWSSGGRRRSSSCRNILSRPRPSRPSSPTCAAGNRSSSTSLCPLCPSSRSVK